MNARRKHRIFADHKPPLVAFFVVAMTSVMLLVHVARSEAAPSWLRQGVASVVAGGAPLAQQVMSGTLVEPAPANAEPPTGPGTAADQAATAHQEHQPADPADPAAS